MSLRLLVLALILLPLGCRSTSASSEVPCTCGTHEADLEGCAHPLCLAGKNNPDNPDCVCGTLSLKKQ